MIESAEEFVGLRSSGEDADRQRARFDELPEQVCREVLDRFPDMRIWLARNETVPMAILAVLAGDEEMVVRRVVAQHRALTAELVDRLSRDENNAVRLMIAVNAATPVNVLERLAATDPWEGVRTMAEKLLQAKRGAE